MLKLILDKVFSQFNVELIFFIYVIYLNVMMEIEVVIYCEVN